MTNPRGGQIEMNKTKMIRVSEEEFSDLIKARTKLLNEGMSKLPPPVKEKIETENPDLSYGALVSIAAMALISLLGGAA